MDEKTLLLEIRNKLDEISFFLPNKVSITDLATNLGIAYQTLYKYILRNFEPEVDFYKIGGKIYVGKDVALCIRRKYAK